MLRTSSPPGHRRVGEQEPGESEMASDDLGQSCVLWMGVGGGGCVFSAGCAESSICSARLSK